MQRQLPGGNHNVLYPMCGRVLKVQLPSEFRHATYSHSHGCEHCIHFVVRKKAKKKGDLQSPTPMVVFSVKTLVPGGGVITRTPEYT